MKRATPQSLSLQITLLFSIMLSPLSQADVASKSAEAYKLNQVFQEYWQAEMALNPVWASQLGDSRYAQQWPDISQSGLQQFTKNDNAALQALKSIDRESLSQSQQLNYDLFAHQYQVRLEAKQFNEELIPLNQRGGIQTLDSTANYINLNSRVDFENWLARLNGIDSYMQQTIALMKRGMATGVMPAAITMSRIPAQIKLQIVSDASQSPFYKPFVSLPNTLSQSEQAEIRSAAVKAISEKVVPAYRGLLTFFEDQYLPACLESIAEIDRPKGREHYEFLVKKFTTTNLCPDEVHQIGMTEVKRIRSEMQVIIDELGFEGDFDDFNHFLRTDPQFYFTDEKDLLNAYQATSKRIDPELVKLFGKLPRMPYGVKPIPDNVAPDTTTAYYSRPAGDGSRPGYFWVNLYQPLTRPKYEIEVLTVHESVPGHHLQIALQQELEGMPEFRKYTGFTAFVEGWGLYSERLGYDLGLYQDPYSRYGQLTYDMWRAVRLVVDTGMHYKGWSRDKAITFFKANAAKTELDIVNEIDRYIAWPGQALAYKLGQLKILSIRANAEKRLGKQFDIRAFHDQILSQGALPLAQLETMMQQWVSEQLPSR